MTDENKKVLLWHLLIGERQKDDWNNSWTSWQKVEDVASKDDHEIDKATVAARIGHEESSLPWSIQLQTLAEKHR